MFNLQHKQLAQKRIKARRLRPALSRRLLERHVVDAEGNLQPAPRRAPRPARANNHIALQVIDRLTRRAGAIPEKIVETIRTNPTTTGVTPGLARIRPVLWPNREASVRVITFTQIKLEQIMNKFKIHPLSPCGASSVPWQGKPRH